MAKISLSGSDLLSLLASKAMAEKIEEKEAEDLEKAIQASLADSDSPPNDTSNSKAPITAESSKSASKRSRGDLSDEDDANHGSAKKLRHGMVLSMPQFLNMVTGSNDTNNGDDGDDDDDEMKRLAIKPDDITTTFDDVHVGPEVHDAFDILSLSIHDPSAFTFGILATSSPQGILLYGPPGTGKTLLVRALAKQAHATILALSGADIRSKFVGEGEKKIKRIFAYARKHPPCVIFIDEADAVFRSRSAGNNCSGHLEDISQFLQEMDGVKSNSIKSPMVVAATNRPFDIDEGVLRRLGKRIMVDVPDAVARRHILSIHLKGEVVANDADIPELADATQDYTGSDLRNLVYAAAIAAVRENLQRSGHNFQEGSSKTPVGGGGHRRVLRKAHFLRARQEIRASPKSETVSKIREFHNKFGNTARRVPLDYKRPEVINKSKAPVSVEASSSA